MNVVDFIPVGRKNAVSRRYLAMVAHMGDRCVRNEIAKARRHNIIINTQDGKGYYRLIPDECEFWSLEEKLELAHFVRQEEHRLKSIGWSLKAARAAAKNLVL